MQTERSVVECEICVGKNFSEVSRETDGSYRTVMCDDCGFFFCSPAISRERLSQFYDEEFDGDPGANQRADKGHIDPALVKKEELRASQWAMPVIEKYMDVSGKRVLDLRSRTGGLAALLARQGATVTATDPMTGNADYLKRREDVDGIYLAPAELDLLPGFEAESFDAVSMLTIHVMAHVISPRILLSRVYEVLKPGGLVFLDEKDIFSPHRISTPSVFSGTGHFYHFTVDSTRRILEANGFDVLECDTTVRKSVFRHIVAVARKPEQARTVEPRTLKADIPDIRRRLASVQRKTIWLSVYNRAKRRFKQRFRAA